MFSLIDLDSPLVASSAACDARDLTVAQRKDLACKAFRGDQPISRLAQEFGASRKFVYQQVAKAEEAIAAAFEPPPAGQEAVIFFLPVTWSWLKQFVLALALIGHCSVRAVAEIMATLLDYRVSVGTIQNVLDEAKDRARILHQGEDLRRIRVGAHDEIFQSRRPILVGCDVASTYCYLLTGEDHRDETTWGFHLLELQKKGLAPQRTIADGGQGLRAGQKAAWPGTPCDGDVFHALAAFGKGVSYLENRAYGRIVRRGELERKMARAKKHGHGHHLSQPLAQARQQEAQACALATDLATLGAWLQNDILALRGPPLAERRLLFDFVIEELRARQDLCPHRLSPLLRLLENQRDELLGFAVELDAKLAQIAQDFAVTTAIPHALAQLLNLAPSDPARWQRETQLRARLQNRNYFSIQAAVRAALADTPRASSVVENLNSRLRNYFFLRHQFGNQYLELLRFFINHHPFERSLREERVGKSPTELLTGKPHSHWLELLGHQRFRRN